MTRLRVLHVSQPAEAGLAEVIISYLVHSDPGVEHVVACPRGTDLAVEVTSLGHGHVPWEAARSPWAHVVAEARALRTLIERLRPDVVHLHCAKAGLVGRLVVRGRRPTVLQPHAWSFSAVTGITRALSLRWERLAQRWTHATVCVSGDERSRGLAAGILRQDHPTRHGHLLPNAVDPAQWPMNDRTAARARLGLPDVPTAVCVGRLCRQKGQDLLLTAWPRVTEAIGGGATSDGSAQLILVGDGPDRAQLEAVRPGRVRFVGTADPRDWYAAADVVVVPSRWEGMALVPLEAQASGRLVVAADVDGVREGLHPEQIVVMPENPAALAAGLIRALSDTARAADVGYAARQLVERQWVPHERDRELRQIYAAAAAAA